MNIIAIQPSGRHPPMPIRDGIAWHCGNAISSVLPQQEIAFVRFNMECLYHLSDVTVRSNRKICSISGRSIITIPIGPCPL
jgi:hypothetical protein